MFIRDGTPIGSRIISITVSPGQFIAYRGFSFLGNPDLYPVVNPCRQVIASVFTIFTGVDFHIDHFAPLTVRHSQ